VAWKRDFDTRRFRIGLDLLLSAATLRAGYSSRLIASLPARFAEVMRSRMERCFARHPNRTNPFVRALLLGEMSDDAPAPRASAIRVACSDAAEFLEQGPAQGYDGFTLSNILDGADAGYRERLFRAVARAAKPNAVAVLRSFAEPSADVTSNRAVDDRSMLWGVVAGLAGGGATLSRGTRARRSWRRCRAGCGGASHPRSSARAFATASAGEGGRGIAS
jgi:hypothetical protein